MFAFSTTDATDPRVFTNLRKFRKCQSANAPPNTLRQHNRNVNQHFKRNTNLQSQRAPWVTQQDAVGRAPTLPPKRSCLRSQPEPQRRHNYQYPNPQDTTPKETVNECGPHRTTPNQPQKKTTARLQGRPGRILITHHSY